MPGITSDDLEPLAVSPRQACMLLKVGATRLYQLLADGELESYLDGRARRITMASIRRRIARLLASAGATGAAIEAPRKARTKPQTRIGTVPTPRRGRPRKPEPAATTAATA